MSPWQLRQALRWLRRGGTIAYPTEAVYGLGCDPFNRQAVQRLLALKRRPESKGLILIAGDFGQVEPWLDLTPDMRQRLQAQWPGPVTFITPAGALLPDWLQVDGKVAVRVTAHRLSAGLCRAFGGPLVSTSANLSGRPPARTALTVQRYFAQDPVLILHGSTGGAQRPSAIYDAVSGVRYR
jgi:L-threonylcarbamoyladenylate synthase